ncbi:hypothetical protein [Phycicoccus sp. DTK01]|uniref:hypothetical protein n=1 Tax=Phycicoccus sp. DTK01 TaxID=2785745 RepID=UPI001A8D38A1|nr:hypothetical protein [Phycicoccus sp. DTK01]GIL36941.1 hypothetical protein PDTK01_30160 [Phycicoccus sp. DTK01]
MTMYSRPHLSSRELAAARNHTGDLVSNDNDDFSPAAARHLSRCAVCKIRVNRLKRSEDPPPPSLDLAARLSSDTPLVSARLVQAMQSTHPADIRPAAGELWRAGHDEALLVWVRDLVGSHAVEVVPVALDASLADETSISIEPDATVLGIGALALVSLRTHIHVDAFINRLDVIDLRAEVEEVILATREHRLPTGVALADHDQWNYATAKADRDDFHNQLLQLHPVVWDGRLDALEASDRRHDLGLGPQFTADPDVEHAATVNPEPDGFWQRSFETISDELEARIWGVQCHRIQRMSQHVNELTLESFFKAFYLDTTVLAVVANRHRNPPRMFDLSAILEALEPLTRIEGDADAVVVSVPSDGPTSEWASVLLTRAHMRTGINLPIGEASSPMFTISGFGLIDTLAKYLDGAIVAWEVLGGSDPRLHGINVHDAAHRHALDSTSRVRTEGSRARTPEKLTGWQLEPTTESAVARFVAAAASDTDFDAAIAELGLEEPDD